MSAPRNLDQEPIAFEVILMGEGLPPNCPTKRGTYETKKTAMAVAREWARELGIEHPIAEGRPSLTCARAFELIQRLVHRNEMDAIARLGLERAVG
jgi:hypothetical protein